MKSSSTIIIVISLVIGFGLISCTEENDSPPEQVLTQIEEILKLGTWKITRFEDSGKDETNHFNGYDFIFGSNGTLTAENGLNRMVGNYSLIDQSRNDNHQNDIDFVIHFVGANDFEELNEDWDFVSYSQSLIELIHVSGGNGGTDYLTFERK